MHSCLSIALCLAAAVSAERAQVTPIAKVITILQGLEKEIAEEGKKEAAAYDKYACFCKEQADNKNYNIERSTEKIAKLDAKIEQLNADISALNGEISELSTTIEGLEGKIATATEARNEEHAAYVEKHDNVTSAISAVERAINAMTASKGAMEGKTQLEALAQVRAVAGYALLATIADGANDDALRVVLHGGQPGENFDYQYHSNDIIAVLEKLRLQFIDSRDRMHQEDFEANSQFEKEKLKWQNEKKFAAQEKLAKEMQEAEKSDNLHAATEENVEEAGMKSADESFLAVLVGDCEAKAGLFDQRSKTRAAELTALAEAIESLQSGVTPNWGANRKLVGLQKQAAVKGHWVWVEDAPASSTKPVSFFQLDGSHRVNSAREATSQAQLLLQNAANSLNSPVLSVAALKVQVSEDHFVKVRGLIKDLVARLEAQQSDEATQKQFCDENIGAAVSERDAQQEQIEDLTAKISANLAESAQLQKDIAALSAAIAANTKALAEATELRAEEKADNEKTLADANAGLDAVKMAIQVLKSFYDAQGVLIQKRFVPENSDREGKTVADLAPDVFDSDYKGKQQESKGVFGLLEIIQSDFERTIDTVTEDESTAEGKFEEFKTKTDEDTAAKEKERTTKETELTNAKDALVVLRDDKATAVNLHASALKSLEKLNSMCVAGDETYAERVAKREKEIAALKEAQKILRDWQA